MAKKKAAAKKIPAKKVAASDGVVAKPATPTTPKTKALKAPPLTSAEIGHAAGRVWQALQGADPLTVSALKKATGLTGDLAMAGLGWLAREDKLHFDDSGRSVKVGLR